MTIAAYLRWKLVDYKQSYLCLKSADIKGESEGTIVAASFHLVVCLTTGPKRLPKQAVHIVRSRDSSFKWEYPLLFLRWSSGFLRLFPRLPVTSIPLFIFPSITCCRKQFLRKMWPIQWQLKTKQLVQNF